MLTITIEELASSQFLQCGSDSCICPRHNSRAPSAPLDGTGEGVAVSYVSTKHVSNGEEGLEKNSTNGTGVGITMKGSNADTVFQLKLEDCPHTLLERDLPLDSSPRQAEATRISSTPSTPSSGSCSPCSHHHSMIGVQACDRSCEMKCRDSHPDGSSFSLFVQLLQKLDWKIETLSEAITLQTAFHKTSIVDARAQQATLQAAFEAQTTALSLLLAYVSPTQLYPTSPEVYVPNHVLVAPLAKSNQEKDHFGAASSQAAHIPSDQPLTTSSGFKNEDATLSQCFNHGSAGAITSMTSSKLLSNPIPTPYVNMKAEVLKKKTDSFGKISPSSSVCIPVPMAYESRCDLINVRQNFSDFTRRHDSQPCNVDQPSSSEPIYWGKDKSDLQGAEGAADERCPDHDFENAGKPLQHVMFMHQSSHAAASSGCSGISGGYPGEGEATARGITLANGNAAAQVTAVSCELASDKNYTMQQQYSQSSLEVLTRNFLEAFPDLS